MYLTNGYPYTLGYYIKRLTAYENIETTECNIKYFHLVSQLFNSGDLLDPSNENFTSQTPS